MRIDGSCRRSRASSDVHVTIYAPAWGRVSFDATAEEIGRVRQPASRWESCTEPQRYVVTFMLQEPVSSTVQSCSDKSGHNRSNSNGNRPDENRDRSRRERIHHDCNGCTRRWRGDRDSWVRIISRAAPKGTQSPKSADQRRDANRAAVRPSVSPLFRAAQIRRSRDEVSSQEYGR